MCQLTPLGGRNPFPEYIHTCYVLQKKRRAGTPSEGLCAWTQGVTHVKVWCDLTAAVLDYRIGVLDSCFAGQHPPTGASTPTLQGISLSRGCTFPCNLVNHTQHNRRQTEKQTDLHTNIHTNRDLVKTALSQSRRFSRLAL